MSKLKGGSDIISASYSCWTHVEFLANKLNGLESYKGFDAMCKTQFATQIKTLHLDRGGEYTANEFQLYLKSHGTKQKLTVHDTPHTAQQHNRMLKSYHSQAYSSTAACESPSEGTMGTCSVLCCLVDESDKLQGY
jgi:hypothetical protein